MHVQEMPVAQQATWAMAPITRKRIKNASSDPIHTLVRCRCPARFRPRRVRAAGRPRRRGSGSSSGTLRVSPTDAPSCGYDHVFVTVQKVRVNQSSTASDTDAGWSEIALNLAQYIDLVTLTNGVLASLGQTPLPTGKYTQRRLLRAANGNASPLANSVVPAAGAEVPLSTPSALQSGLAPPAPLNGTANGAVTKGTSPIGATVNGLQTLCGGDTIEVAGGPVDATFGSYSYALAPDAPVVAAYVFAPGTLAFAADSAVADRCTPAVISGAVTKTSGSVTISSAQRSRRPSRFHSPGRWGFGYANDPISANSANDAQIPQVRLLWQNCTVARLIQKKGHNMNIKTYRSLGAAVLAVTLCLQAPLAQAGIVTTDQLTAQHDRDAERARIQSFLDRASVRDKIQAMGIDGLAAKDRVAALNDQEVHALAERIDSLPTGGNVGSFTNDQLIIVLLIAILVAVIVSA